MKNLIAELLVKLAEKEVESEEQAARLHALEIVVTSLINRMNSSELNDLTCGIKDDIARVMFKSDNVAQNPELLQLHVQRLLQPKL